MILVLFFLNILVHGHLHDETKNSFTIGMFVEAEIEVTKKEALSLPEGAIIENGEHQVVLKLEANKNNEFHFEPIEVEVGKTYNGFTEIRFSTLKPNDKILVKGGYSLVGAEGGGHSH